MRRVLVPAALIGLALAASGCTRIRYNMGYIVDEQLVAAVQPGVDNKASVQQTLGRPSFNSQFDDQQWYYLSRNMTQTAFLMPKTTDQKVIIISFDKTGNVAKIDKRGLEKVASITPIKDQTPTLGRKHTIFRDIFGNIGAVGTSQAPDPTKQ